MRATTRTAAAVAVTALLTAGCGAADDEPTATPEVSDVPDDDASDDVPADDGGPADGAPDDGASDDSSSDAADELEFPGDDRPGERFGDGDSQTGSGSEAVAGLDEATDVAIADLAASSGLETDAIEVVTAEPVTWSDGSLGCPDEGGMYTQALVPGYRVILSADGEEVAYHGAEGRAPSRCDDPQPPTEGAT